MTNDQCPITNEAQIIRVPTALRLLIQSSAEPPMFCPYPVDRIVTRAAAVKALLDRIRGELEYRPRQMAGMPMRIVTHG